MSKIENISISDLRNATRAWRRNGEKAAFYWGRSGFMKFLTSAPNMSLYDRIDELVDEIARLRSALGEYDK